ncbi:MAG TPA: hypothetical protein VLU25_12270 [Acidobacteriota bacterium]|nr:hypothetical protein [Acidobacteriota bacterium]
MGEVIWEFPLNSPIQDLVRGWFNGRLVVENDTRPGGGLHNFFRDHLGALPRPAMSRTLSEKVSQPLDGRPRTAEEFIQRRSEASSSRIQAPTSSCSFSGNRDASSIAFGATFP